VPRPPTGAPARPSAATSVELRHLRYFVAVVEEGQISAAARRLHLAQPALSQAIQALEHAVGVQLLDRHARRVTATAAGVRVFTGAKSTIATAEHTIAVAREEAPEGRTVTVGAIPAAPRLGEIAAAFRRAHPDVGIVWKPLDFIDDARVVGDGDVDAAFVLPDYRVAGDVVLEDVFPAPVFMYASIESPLAGLDVARFEDFADEVFPRQAEGVAHEFADLFYLTALRGHRPAVGARAPLTPDEVWALVASGAMITTAPGSHPTIAADAIRRIPTIDVPPFMMRLMWRADTSPATHVFVEFVRSTFGAARLRVA
jgi:DNA-binding transcriptional LysR family regulator